MSAELAVLTADVDAAEEALLGLPQVDFVLVHSFAPGLYIREMTVPADCMVIGHAHRQCTLNLMLKGRILVVDGDGARRELVAPYQFVSPPGRKVAHVLEETVWINVFPNPDDETDIETLEERYSDRSQAWLSHRDEQEIKTLAAVPEERGS